MSNRKLLKVTSRKATTYVHAVIVDPLTGQSFSCLTIYRGGGYHGGPAMWCHEVQP